MFVYDISERFHGGLPGWRANGVQDARPVGRRPGPCRISCEAALTSGSHDNEDARMRT